MILKKYDFFLKTPYLDINEPGSQYAKSVEDGVFKVIRRVLQVSFARTYLRGRDVMALYRSRGGCIA